MQNQTLLEPLPSSDQLPKSQTQTKSIERSKSTNATTSKVHFVLQGKGGIGKSFVSIMLAQYLKDKNLNVTCFDTDPINKTFSSIQDLGVKPLKLLDENNAIDESGFDFMLVQLLNTDTNFVVDNGAASYLPLSTYIIESEAFDAIQKTGKQVLVHSIIAGGLAQDHIIAEFGNLTSQLPDGVNVIVWLNEFFGPIEAKGKSFEEMKVYLENKHRIGGIVHIPKRREVTFGKDLSTMLKRNLTFREALENPDFNLITRQRLKIVQRDIYSQLEVIL